MPEEFKDKRRRAVAVERLIKNLKKDDTRVAVIGTVLTIDEQSLIVTMEDKTGSLTVLCQTEDMIKNLKQGELVRVTGIVLPYEDGFELRAELVQDFSKLNPELFPVLQKLLE